MNTENEKDQTAQADALIRQQVKEDLLQVLRATRNRVEASGEVLATRISMKTELFMKQAIMELFND